ncbi:dnaJ, partial [Symbiodinium necroappetens]
MACLQEDAIPSPSSSCDVADVTIAVPQAVRGRYQFDQSNRTASFGMMADSYEMQEMVKEFSTGGSRRESVAGAKIGLKKYVEEEDVKETMVSKTVRLFTGPDINKEVPDVDDSLLSKARRVATDFAGWWDSLKEPERVGSTHRALESRWFRVTSAMVIVINAIVVTWLTDWSLQNTGRNMPPGFEVVDLAFLLFYAAEIGMKFYVHRGYYFANENAAWNIFDLILVIFSSFDVAANWPSSSDDEAPPNNLGYMLSLYMAVTGGNDWSVYYEATLAMGSFYPVVFLSYTFFFIFALFNILTGVFVERAVAAALPDREELIAQERKKILKQVEDLRALFKALDSDRSGKISKAEFLADMEDDRIVSYMHTLGLDMHDAEHFFDLLANDRNQQEVDIDTFIEHCMSMKGTATAMDLHKQMVQAETDVFKLERKNMRASAFAIAVVMYPENKTDRHSHDHESHCPYAILGVAQNASTEDIKRAFKERAKITHPDVVKGRDKHFREMVDAYRVLRDPRKRAEQPGHVAKQRGEPDLSDGWPRGEGQGLSEAARAKLYNYPVGGAGPRSRSQHRYSGQGTAGMQGSSTLQEVAPMFFFALLGCLFAYKHYQANDESKLRPELYSMRAP